MLALTRPLHVALQRHQIDPARRPPPRQRQRLPRRPRSLPLEHVAGDDFETVILAITTIRWVVAVVLSALTRGILGSRATGRDTEPATGDVVDPETPA